MNESDRDCTNDHNESCRFTPAYRLRSKADFAAMRKARRLQFESLRFVQRPNDLTHGRIGFAVSRKYGNSVARHRFKRIAREVFRSHTVRHQAVDILLIPNCSSDMWQHRGDALRIAIEGGFNRVAARSGQRS